MKRKKGGDKIMKKCKKIIAMTLCFLLLIGTTINSYGYTRTGYKWSSSTIKYYYDSTNSTRAQSYIQSGASAWNSTDVTFTKNGSYNVYCSQVSYSNYE